MVLRHERVPAFGFVFEADDQEFAALLALWAWFWRFLQRLLNFVSVAGDVWICDGVEFALNRLNTSDLAAVSVSVVNVYDLIIISLSGRIDLAEALWGNLVERTLKTTLMSHRQLASKNLVVGGHNTTIEH